MKYKRVWRKFEQNRDLGWRLNTATNFLRQASEVEDPCEPAVEALKESLWLQDYLRGEGETVPEELLQASSRVLEGLKDARRDRRVLQVACWDAYVLLCALVKLLKR
jgi:hypothetical protein